MRGTIVVDNMGWILPYVAWVVNHPVTASLYDAAVTRPFARASATRDRTVLAGGEGGGNEGVDMDGQLRRGVGSNQYADKPATPGQVAAPVSQPVAAMIDAAVNTMPFDADAPGRVTRRGARVWHDTDGRLHRDGGPALERLDGERQWWRHGLLHREGGPAIQGPAGRQVWFRHGQLHRDGGPAITTPHGHEGWFVDGVRHREDGPACTTPIGSQIWYQHGVVHRDDGPAVINPNGRCEWRRDGVLHRDDGPAMVWPASGDDRFDWEVWYRDGVRHRDDGGPAVIDPDGTQFWMVDGEIHRDGGPAVIRPDGGQAWRTHGVLHRDDGPAVVFPDGTGQWWLNGTQVSPPGEGNPDE